MKDHPIEMGNCPTCFYKMTMAMNAEPSENQPPKKDDFTICGMCGEILVFDADLKMKKATDKQLDTDLLTKGALLHAQEAVRRTRAMMKIKKHLEKSGVPAMEKVRMN